MDRPTSIYALSLVLVLAIVGGVLALIFGPVLAPSQDVRPMITEQARADVLEDRIVFAPPRPEDAPESIREAVMLGYNVFVHTQEFAPQYVGNELNCTNCHFEGGRAKKTLSLVGVAAKYPRYRERQSFASHLVTRTSGCFERSLNGTAPPPEGEIMTALITYYSWISRGVPMYADVPWLGLPPLTKSVEPDAAHGDTLFVQHCSVCHGMDGAGTRIAPPLWGPGSYNRGAGMAEVPTLASFAQRYMPRGDPYLSPEQAWHIAKYVDTRPRPELRR